MISIQTAGTEILTNTPRSLYFFVGSEYGIKEEYIDRLAAHYGSIQSADSLFDLIDLMSTKRLFALAPTVYVCRYYESFISTIDQAHAAKLLSCTINGTIVGIYEQPKHAAKLDKLLPNNTVTIDPISVDLQVSYLLRQYPSVPEHTLKTVAQLADSYGHARRICHNLAASQSGAVYEMSDQDLVELFGSSTQLNETAIRRAIASRNFSACLRALDQSDDADAFLYSLLSTLVELEKIKCSPYSSSDLKELASRWNIADIYAMFANTYAELLRSRSMTTDVRNRLIYLFSVMQFSPVPFTEELV